MKSPYPCVIVTMALLLSACTEASSRGPTAPTPTPLMEFDTVFIKQSACLFDCPVFEVEISSDGRVRHSGPEFERTGGPHESRIDRRGLTQIAKALRDARLDDMRNSYQDEKDGCESRITDLSTLSFLVNRDQGRHTKSVILYAGCLGPTIPTARVNALIKAIDQVTGTGALLEQRKKAGRPDGEADAPSK